MSLGTQARKLPEELQLAVARGMGCDATIGEWCRFRWESKSWSVTFDTLFAEWLSLQPSQRWFWHFAGKEEEVALVAEHADCECTRPYHNGSPTDPFSASRLRYICALYSAV